VVYTPRSDKSEYDDDLEDDDDDDSWEPGARKLDENANFGITND